MHSHLMWMMFMAVVESNFYFGSLFENNYEKCLKKRSKMISFECDQNSWFFIFNILFNIYYYKLKTFYILHLSCIVCYPSKEWKMFSQVFQSVFPVPRAIDDYSLFYRNKTQNKKQKMISYAVCWHKSFICHHRSSI